MKYIFQWGIKFTISIERFIEEVICFFGSTIYKILYSILVLYTKILLFEKALMIRDLVISGKRDPSQWVEIGFWGAFISLYLCFLVSANNSISRFVIYKKNPRISHGRFPAGSQLLHLWWATQQLCDRINPFSNGLPIIIHAIRMRIRNVFSETLLTHCIPFEPVKSWCVGTQPRVVQGQFLGDSSQGIGARERVRKYG